MTYRWICSRDAEVPGCERASLDFRLDTKIPQWILLRNSGTKFINRLLLCCAVLCCAMLSEQNSRVGVRANGRKQRIFVDFPFWGIMFGPQCMLSFYSVLKTRCLCSTYGSVYLTGREAHANKLQTLNSFCSLYCSLARRKSPQSQTRLLSFPERAFFFFHAAFQVFESLKMRMLETGYASCCALWRMIF